MTSPPMSDDLAEAVERITFERVTGEWALEGDLLDYGPLGFSISTQSYKVQPSTRIYRQVPLTAPTPVTEINLRAAGYDLSVSASGVRCMNKGLVTILLDPSGTGENLIQFNNVYCHPQPTTMEDLTRLSRPKPQ